MDLKAFIPAAEALGVLGVKVSQGGECIAQWLFEEECRRNIYSASKSFTAVAVGFALQEGRLRLEERLTDAFADDLPDTVSASLEKATVRDLLTMCLGQPEAHLMGGQRPFLREENWARLALAQPFTDMPGTKFVYNNVGPYLAGLLVQRRAGCDLVHYLKPRLFDPLGIQLPTWETDPLGNTFGAGRLFLSLWELHAFGQFCLDFGAWNGVQLLDEGWLRECSRPQDDPGYGYLFWRGEYDSFRADGKYGQLAIALPKKRALITVVAECRQTDRLFRHIYDDICPQL